MAAVALVGTLDTKGDEYAFLRDQLVEAGLDVIMVNAGILDDPGYPVEHSRHAVARAAGTDLDSLIHPNDRGAAVSAMARGATSIIRSLQVEEQIHGVLGIGGSGGSSIVSQVMRALPVGFPKLLVSTMASGDVSVFVGTADITMMYSVVDLAGINSISKLVLTNASSAMAGMAIGYSNRTQVISSRPVVGMTMYGATTRCVQIARSVLEEAGYEVLVFHATGNGGRSMESLVRSGHIAAVLDVTTTELIDEIAGGTLSAGPDRLEVAGKRGIPQVVSVGAVDMVTFSPPQSVPSDWSERVQYAHNPSITLVRSNAEECYEFGKRVGQKLKAAKGPTSVFFPLRGTSSYAVEGGVFHDPAADSALRRGMVEALGGLVEYTEIDTDINDPLFARSMARRLLEMLEGDRPELADG